MSSKPMLSPSQPVVPRKAGVLTSVSAPPAALLWTARRAAIRQLAQKTSCGCCDSLRAHLFMRLGSTLFLDDDPRRLLQAFSAAERVFITPQTIAAYIVLWGRERVNLYPAERPSRWPAFALLAPLD